MSGDFLALLPKQSFPSLNSSAASPMHIEATTVFAFHCAEGVVIAGDHRATAGNTVFSDRTEKILELDSHSLMAIAGVPATAFEMARTLQTAFEFYRRSQLQAMSLAAKTRALSRLLRENLPATLQGVGAVSPIFVGIDGDTNAKPVIYFYDPLGAHFDAAKFAGSGSGSPFIKSVLHYLIEWGNPHPAEMSIPQAVVLANRLLMTAAEFDTATGGVHPGQRDFATIKFLSGDGVRSISREEQEGFWRDSQ
ncbi:MAG TPA: proteasome subunit alpha [Clostridia bacterium]|nr:proteasome subunit alpha [Clostridia bacterium]